MNIPSQDYHDFIDSLKEDADRRGDEARECEQDRLIHEAKIAELECRIAAYEAFVDDLCEAASRVATAIDDHDAEECRFDIVLAASDDLRNVLDCRAALDEWNPR